MPRLQSSAGLLICFMLENFMFDSTGDVVKYVYDKLRKNRTMRHFNKRLIRESYKRIQSDHNIWINDYQESQFMSLFRMKQATFYELLNVLLKYDKNGLIEKRYRGGYRPVEPKKMLLVFLWYMSHQDTINAVGDKFNLVPSTVMQLVNNVLYILMQLKNQYIYWPRNEEEFEHLANGFKHYPGAIGAVDGTHIFCRVPRDQHDSYVDRYMRHSINLMAICNAERVFTYIYIGFPGSAHDSRVFDNSLLARNIENYGPQKYFFDTNKYHIIGDSAFPLRPWLMTPYKKNHNLNRIEKKHNYCLSADRVIIENSFGHLKGRWQRLQFINCYNIAKAIEIATAACVLHNFCIIHTDKWEGEVFEEQSNNWDDHRDNNCEQQRLGRAKRDGIAAQLWNV